MFKRKIMVALTVATLVTTAMFGSFAEYKGQSYVPEADALKAMGLFAGTNNGYELDRAPTRAEAATMLVKLLGGESEAKTKNYKHPFKDLPTWANPFVGYMYEKGLTVGIGNGLYGSNDLTKAKDYTTFVLKALGYDADKDFKWDSAVKFAESKTIFTIQDVEDLGYLTFTRNEMVHISYNTLKSNLKGSSTRLIDSLVNNGAVTKSAAESTGMLVVGEVFKFNVTIKGNTFDADTHGVDPKVLANTVYVSESDIYNPNMSDIEFAQKFFFSDAEKARTFGAPGDLGKYVNRQYFSWTNTIYLYMDGNGITQYYAVIPKGLPSGTYSFDLKPTSQTVKSLIAKTAEEFKTYSATFKEGLTLLTSADIQPKKGASGMNYVSISPSKIDPSRYTYYFASGVYTDDVQMQLNTHIESVYKHGLFGDIVPKITDPSNIHINGGGLMSITLLDANKRPVAFGIFNTD
jgi:hypothetical protein